MKDQIRHAERKVEQFKDALYRCDDSMSDFYYQKALSWIRHVADLKKQQEQNRVAN